jgi:hypothetical protein
VIAVTSWKRCRQFWLDRAGGADADQDDCAEDSEGFDGGDRDEIDDDLLHAEGLQDGTDHGCGDNGGTGHGHGRLFSFGVKIPTLRTARRVGHLVTRFIYWAGVAVGVDSAWTSG